jgi:hypothetical protein
MAPISTPRLMEVDSADLIDADAHAEKGKSKQVQSFLCCTQFTRTAQL